MENWFAENAKRTGTPLNQQREPESEPAPARRMVTGRIITPDWRANSDAQMDALDRAQDEARFEFEVQMATSRLNPVELKLEGRELKKDGGAHGTARPGERYVSVIPKGTGPTQRWAKSPARQGPEVRR